MKKTADLFAFRRDFVAFSTGCAPKPSHRPSPGRCLLFLTYHAAVARPGACSVTPPVQRAQHARSARTVTAGNETARP